MTAAATAEAGLGPAQAVSKAQLLDVLYEILAQGVEPEGELESEQVEAFLHEHARSEKSLEEMLAFFTQHGLSTDPSDYGGDAELDELASGIHRERGPVSAMLSLDEAMAPDEPVTGKRAVVTPAEVVRDFAVERSDVSRREPPVVVEKVVTSSFLRVAIAGLCVALIGVVALGRAREQKLEAQLSQARLQQQTTDAALSALEQRAESLRSELGSSEARRHADQEAMKGYLAEQSQRRAAEQAALSRLLGPRYATLTEKALSESVVPASE